MDEWIYAPAPGIRIRAFDGLKVKTMSSQIPKPHFKLINMRFSLFFHCLHLIFNHTTMSLAFILVRMECPE